LIYKPRLTTGEDGPVAHIIVVDDDQDIRDWVGSVLREAGHDVVSAPDGIAALDILDGGGPLDLLLTDVIMPGLNGFNLARMARVRRPRLRILYLSGWSESEHVTRDVGVRHGKMLAKPIRAAELTHEVCAALKSNGCSTPPAP
jgi:DNA-binding response OmpR family regulator